jgi:hypothetical protein
MIAELNRATVAEFCSCEAKSADGGCPHALCAYCRSLRGALSLVSMIAPCAKVRRLAR